jgi:hypothetical protein
MRPILFENCPSPHKNLKTCLEVEPRDLVDKSRSRTTLCETIEASKGKDVFKSDVWLDERRIPVTNAATNAVGGWVCGEIKSLMIRMLAGASYLDLLNQYGVSTASLYEFFVEHRRQYRSVA